MSAHTPVTDDTFILGYKVGAALYGTIEDATKAIRRREGSSWIPLYRKNHIGAALLADVEALYTELGDFENDWPGRVSETGQGLLISLRTMLAKATGRTEQEVQDDYGTRAARARAGA